MRRAASWLLEAWRNPASFPAQSVEVQDLVLRLGRQSGLLASLAVRLEQADSLDPLPERIRALLEGARMIATDRERSIRWEVNRIQRAFLGTGLPVILLKGAAYHLRDLPMAQGRLTGDVDLLLPETELPLAERALREQGWLSAVPDPYDQRYYREWMHELPPMRHAIRMSELDLHHAILPRTARLSPDSNLLLQAIEPVAGTVGLWTLGEEDLVLHAVVHLFHDGDFQRLGLRDLLDLDGFFRHFSRREAFWDRLLERAERLQLSRPLDHALRTTARLCHTPIPERIRHAPTLQAASPRLSRKVLDLLIEPVLLPRHPDRKGPHPFSSLAGWLLYVRSHWLRMPPRLLIPHLARKWARKWPVDVWNRRTV